jgi:ABC-type nitrate/sulfonate/bicarbonate transport system substrate-binding protein
LNSAAFYICREIVIWHGFCHSMVYVIAHFSCRGAGLVAIDAAAGALSEIWYARSPGPTPLALAIQLGWIQQVLNDHGGIHLRILGEVGEESRPLRRHESPLPNSFRHGASLPALWARANGQATRVIGLSWTDEYQALIALPDSGLSTIRELRGRRIGIPKHDVLLDQGRASALRACHVALAVEGLSIADVELVDLPDHPIPSATLNGSIIATGAGRRGRYRYVNEAAALSRGDVDAVYVRDAQGAQTTRWLGARVIGDIGFHPDVYVRINNGTPRPLTVSQFLLDRHPELVCALLAQVVSAGRWAVKHPDAVMTLLARESGVSEHWARVAYGANLHRRLELDLSSERIGGLGSFKSFVASQGFLAREFDVRTWMDPVPLRHVIERPARIFH